MSQFSRRIPTDEDTETSEALDMLAVELDQGDGYGDEEPEVGADDGDEIAHDVATSDEATVTEIVDEADLSTRLAPLLGYEANIARVAIAKVGSQNLE